MRTIILTSAAVLLVASVSAIASLGEINGQLEDLGASVRLAVVEYYTASQQAGQTIYFDDRTHQLGAHFVPADPRRGGYDDISWLSDQTEGTANGLTIGETQSALSDVMDT